MRSRLAALMVLTTSVVAPTALAREQTSGRQSVQTLDDAVLVQLNAIRSSHGLAPLKPNRVLTTAATVHSRQMLADGYFAHNSADGSPFWKRLVRYTSGSANGYWSVGENLLWSSPDVDATHALAQWMASPGHRQNILTARWRDVGIAAVHAEDASGTYGDQAVTVITTDFGVRG